MVFQFDDTNGAKNIFKQHKEISELDIIKQAQITWGNHGRAWEGSLQNQQVIFYINPASVPADRPHFFRRVRSRMIAKRVRGCLKYADWETLLNYSSKFTWASNTEIKWDVPTLLWLLLTLLNPSTHTSIMKIKDAI